MASDAPAEPGDAKPERGGKNAKGRRGAAKEAEAAKPAVVTKGVTVVRDPRKEPKKGKIFVDIGDRVRGPRYNASGKLVEEGQVLIELSIPELQAELKEKRAGIFIGPEFGTVSRPDLVKAAREAGEAGFDALIACAFNYDAHSTEFAKLGRIPVRLSFAFLRRCKPDQVQRVLLSGSGGQPRPERLRGP